jgi:hypothetical protein
MDKLLKLVISDFKNRNENYEKIILFMNKNIIQNDERYKNVNIM